ncbi:MAG: adenylate kinase [Spirochaetaceae bacterium]|nr:MAG: adenylate kinase [Spirochaetaceae bacterium]
MNIVFLGPPGAGKGTMAERVADETGLAHVSTGDIFRDNIRHETELGRKVKELIDRGQLVPDSITIELVQDRLHEADVQLGWILDGFPRTRPQAEALSEFARVDLVILLNISDEEVIRRLSGRRVHPESGRTYHVEFNPPAKEGHDDVTGEPLIRRDDDDEESIRTRLSVYKEQTEPVIAYYRKHKLIVDVDASGTIDEVQTKIHSLLKE